MSETTKSILSALAPLASSLLGAIGRLIAGVSDPEALTLWRQAREDIETASIRLSEIEASIHRRDLENDARLGR